MAHSTYPISLREAALALEWGDTRAAEKRLKNYIEKRVADGAPDPTYRVGDDIKTTMRRLYAALPELDSTTSDPFQLSSNESVTPQRLITMVKEVAEEVYENHDLDRIRKIRSNG